jgi:hypothetical protein
MCHCGQCRKQTSHVYVSTHVPKSALTMTAAADLRWYAATDAARRGFCGACGSVLFWDPAAEDSISVSLGALQEPHSGMVEKHIFTAHKGGYYDIQGSLPQCETF